MKIRIKHFYAALALLATTFGMPSCDSDDDDAKPDTEVNGVSSEEDGSSSEEVVTPHESVGGTVPTVAEAVDLGLPSGTLWAPYNVGATAPGEAGAYFAWGETFAKEKYRYTQDWYRWTTWTQSGKVYVKYNETDGKTILEPSDDAATYNWGDKWCMPTLTRLEELFNNCSQVWKEAGEYADGSLAGCLLTGKNGKTLFLPAAGGCWQSIYSGNSSVHYGVGNTGYYWSAELSSSNEFLGIFSIYFGSGYWHKGVEGRYFGYPVRPVCSSAE